MNALETRHADLLSSYFRLAVTARTDPTARPALASIERELSVVEELLVLHGQAATGENSPDNQPATVERSTVEPTLPYLEDVAAIMHELAGRRR